jgi:hypothetical protein
MPDIKERCSGIASKRETIPVREIRDRYVPLRPPNVLLCNPSWKTCNSSSNKGNFFCDRHCMGLRTYVSRRCRRWRFLLSVTSWLASRIAAPSLEIIVSLGEGREIGTEYECSIPPRRQGFD